VIEMHDRHAEKCHWTEGAI